MIFVVPMSIESESETDLMIEEGEMRNTKVLTILLVAGLALSAPLIANAKKGGGGSGGGEPQKGGLPALENRVEADEAVIATLQKDVAALQGQNNWAVISAAGTIARSSGTVANPVTVAEHIVGSGVYEINFGKDVSGCVYSATIGDTANAVPAQGQISVSGDVDADSPDDVYVQTFDKTGTTLTDSPFHLYVSCQ
jgi:hypothetical protein